MSVNGEPVRPDEEIVAEAAGRGIGKLRIPMKPEVAEARAMILNGIKSKEPGLDIARVKQFFVDRGLFVGDFVILDTADVDAVKGMMEDIGYKIDNDLFNHNIYGYYDTKLDLVVLKLDPKLEEANGVIYTEAILVHELMHSTCPAGFEKKQLSDTGHAWYSGKVFEEGLAEMMKGEYIAENLADPIQLIRLFQFARSKLGRNQNINLNTMGEFYKGEEPLPLKYFQFGEERTISYSYIAFGLELLCAKNKNLRAALLKARNCAGDLNEVESIINEISPGLFRLINKCSFFGKYRILHVTDLLKIIIHKVYNGNLHLDSEHGVSGL